jgi:DDE superfamily endonuclease
VPKNWDENVTLISSMNLEGMGLDEHRGLSRWGCLPALRGAPSVPDARAGPDRGDRQPPQVHKMKKVRELIERCGCQLVFLPSYSPDFNPIEEAFSKVKGLLRKAKARSFEALVEATGRALSAVTKEDARGFFTHRGYRMPWALSL